MNKQLTYHNAKYSMQPTGDGNYKVTKDTKNAHQVIYTKNEFPYSIMDLTDRPVILKSAKRYLYQLFINHKDITF